MEDRAAFWQLIKGRKLHRTYNKATLRDWRYNFRRGTISDSIISKVLTKAGYVLKKRSEWVKPRNRTPVKGRQ